MSVELSTDRFVPTQRQEIADAINELLDDFMEALVNSTIIVEIKRLAVAANIPQGFIDGVSFRRTSPNHGVIINTWGTQEKPLARWFNYGTRQHWIAPVNKKALAWTGGGSHGHAIFFKGDKGSDKHFSKGHYVSGVPKTEVMERGYTVGLAALRAEAASVIKREFRYEQ